MIDGDAAKVRLMKDPPEEVAGIYAEEQIEIICQGKNGGRYLCGRNRYWLEKSSVMLDLLDADTQAFRGKYGAKT